MKRMETIPAEAFLAAYPPEIRQQAEILRRIVRRAVPDSVEAVRPGWRLIGYEVPAGRRLRYFAYVALEPMHVHLGFEHGVLMADPDVLLEGAHLKLKKVRFVTYRPGDRIPEEALERLTREAARVASLSRQERLGLLLDRTEEGGRRGSQGDELPQVGRRSARRAIAS
jgi:hypothetical protein